MVILVNDENDVDVTPGGAIDVYVEVAPAGWVTVRLTPSVAEDMVSLWLTPPAKEEDENG